jgi:hemoglobin-like flavoprotein
VYEGPVVMSPSQLKLVRNFFLRASPQVPQVVAAMYGNFFVLAPEAAVLFQGEMEVHHQRFTLMFTRTVELMRSCHLWPVLALSGQAVIPGMDGLRCRHMQAGVTPEYYAKMKLALIQALETLCAGEFTPEVRIALSQVYDILVHSMTTANAGGEDEEAMRTRFLNREAPAAPAPGGAPAGSAAA